MKVATFNLKNDYISLFSTHWSKRKNAVGQFFRDEMPDIAGTQELTIDAICDMEEMLSEYCWIGEGRGGEKKGEYCAVFYRKDQMTCLEHGTFWLARQEQVPNKRDWFSAFPRICTWGLFQDRHGRRFHLYNTHLDVVSPFARKNGIRLIMEHMKENYENTTYPCILTGDFNATPESQVLRMMRETNQCSGIFQGDSYQAALNASCSGEEKANCCQMKTYHGFRGRTEGVPIDYIFVSKGILIEETEIKQKMYGGKYPSDHFPIVMKIKIEM